MIYDYIVIGSGISGVYSGYLLNKKYNVLILEKNNYIGGRIKDVKFHNAIVKLGAGIGQYKNKNLLALLDKCNIKYNIAELDKRIISNKELTFDITIAIKLIKEKYYELDEIKSNDIHILTVQQFLIKYFGKTFSKNYIKYCGYNDFVNSDITYHIKYYPIEDHLLKKTKKLFFQWSDLINSLIGGLKIKLNTNVTNIKCIDNVFNIYTENMIYKSNKIIFAVTINPLCNLTKNLNLNINYKKYIGTIKYLRIYTYHKNGHNFNKTNKRIGGYNILVDNNPLQKVIIISDKILMSSYCDSKYALYWEKIINHTRNNDKLKNTLLYWLRKVEPNTNEVTDVVYQFWDEAVHYYKPMVDIKKQLIQLQNPINNMYVVGELVSLRHGWVEGAIGSVNKIIKL
jgi:protoporphyrinogen oxidase